MYQPSSNNPNSKNGLSRSTSMDLLQRIAQALRNPSASQDLTNFGRAGGVSPSDASTALMSASGPVMGANGGVNVRSFKNPLAQALQEKVPVSVSVSHDTPESHATQVVSVQPLRTEDLLGGY